MARLPAFALSAADGTTVRSRDLKGTPVVLYCYPKDLTPGCTTEACDFRDRWRALRRLGVGLYGVSPDPVERHRRFAAKHDLPFVLLSDPDHVLLEKLGAWGEKRFMGRTYQGVLRSTFLVDEAGRIVRDWRDVRVKGHAEEVLAAARELVRGATA